MKNILIGLFASSIGCALCLQFVAAAQAETVVYSFCNQTGCPDGANPGASLINAKGILYGITQR